MRITILIDDPQSWFIPYGEDLRERFERAGHSAALVNTSAEVRSGDCLFILSCGRIIRSETLRLNRNNIVVHASKLPEGRGFAPLAWQVLEGRNEIWVTAFEAVEKVDAGQIYLQEPVQLKGHELHDELRDLVGKKVVDLASRFVKDYPLPARPQVGISTWYRRRVAADSELDTSKTLRELFDQLRIASNEDYPAFFRLKLNGIEQTYVLKIFKQS